MGENRGETKKGRIMGKGSLNRREAQRGIGRGIVGRGMEA
jgi:hypothetical protein